MTVVWYCFACLHRTVSSSRSWSTMTGICSRTYIRKSRATWSLRLRAVWSRLPASPMRAVRRASTFMWMSSLSAVNSTFPASMSARMPSSPSVMAATSSLEMMPQSPSIFAWAREPVMSSLYSLWSNWMEALKSLTRASVSLPNRPDQSFIAMSFHHERGAKRSSPSRCCVFSFQRGVPDRGRGMRPCRGTRGMRPPLFFVLPKKSRRRSGGKETAFVSKSCPFGQVWTSTGVVRIHAA